MPLLKGKKNIGHNIREMEKAGHPHKQAVAAALHTAYPKGSKRKRKHSIPRKDKNGFY